MPREADTIIEGDELEEEIGQPELGPEEHISGNPLGAQGGLVTEVPNRGIGPGSMGPPATQQVGGGTAEITLNKDMERKAAANRERDE